MLYTLKIDNTEQALRMIEFLKTLDFIELTEEPIEELSLLEEIELGLKDVKNKKVRPIEELLTELKEEQSSEVKE